MNLEMKWCGKLPGYGLWQIQGLSSHALPALADSGLFL